MSTNAAATTTTPADAQAPPPEGKAEMVASYVAAVHDLVLARPPAELLREAREAAVAIQDVIRQKPEKVLMNGHQYLEFEDWQTVGHFYGIAPQLESEAFVRYDLGERVIAGWEATLIAVHVASGKVVSRASAMCLNDEEKWSTRSKYEYHYLLRSGGHQLDDPGRDELLWEDVTEEERRAGKKSRPKKIRVKVAEEPVPLFQLRSMAQTRAGSKVLRMVLAYVAVLAGYRPTPAEELPADRVERVDSTGRPVDATTGEIVEGDVERVESTFGRPQAATPPPPAPVPAAPTPTQQSFTPNPPPPASATPPPTHGQHGLPEYVQGHKIRKQTEAFTLYEVRTERRTYTFFNTDRKDPAFDGTKLYGQCVTAQREQTPLVCRYVETQGDRGPMYNLREIHRHPMATTGGGGK